MSSHLEGLNEAQKTAVLTTKGPVLVLAGAGSGKTRVITHRIIHLILEGVAPHKILAVTFTNKAAKEMRERVMHLLGKFGATERAGIDSVPTVTTFHALGVRMLREHHEVFGLRKQFTIYDRSDSTSAIKKALERAGYDQKQFEPRRMLSIISKAKGDAVSQTDFAGSTRSFPEKVAAEVWKHYDEILRDEHALDFDDLLAKTLSMLKSHPEIRESYFNRFEYVHVDEYQDTNRVQLEIARLIVGDRANLCVVGDVDQCLVPGTKVTMADGKTKVIESIKKGDLVLSYYGSGDVRPARVQKVYSRTSKSKMLVKITTTDGTTLSSTANHTHFAGYVLGTSPQTFMTYLMWKENIGWRLGTTQMYTKGQKKIMPGFTQRSNHEHADAIWILCTHDSIQKARIEECTLSLRYGIPTIPFVARKGGSEHGYVHDQRALEKIFSVVRNDDSARKLLARFGLTESLPHHRPQATRSERKNIHVSLCGDRRGKTPMHRISFIGSDAETKKLLIANGYSVRSAKASSQSWRFESAHSSFDVIAKIVQHLTEITPSCYTTMTARFGKQHGTANKNSLQFMPASSIRAGMGMFDATGNYKIVAKVEEVPSTSEVFDLDIVHTHNFIANGIATHNSIYSWRGADIKNILQFERHFPQAKIIMLEENYRSTQTIIAASNDIIEKNINRPEKKVFTNNHAGELISLYAAMGGQEEAEYVALTAKDLVKKGVSPSEIAVLFRTNFQSRALEEAFINFGVPYQMLGTRFFERREVKDVLSYLRFAFNPDSTADLVRIINTPARGIGKVTVLKVVEGRAAELPAKTREKVDAFYRLMHEIQTFAEQHPVHETLAFIIKQTGLETEFKQGGEEGLERLENVRELVSLGTKYVEYEPLEAIEHLIEDSALGSDQDELKEKEDFDAVRLMTVHASKGLEFPYVFITGLEEGLFPHERLGGDERIDEEEERRLFYVALTRAGKKVFLTYAHIRTIFGSQRVNAPSSFLHDIRSELLDSKNPSESGYERTIYLD